MKYKWLLFDLDGTLFDYESAEKYALSNTFQKHGFEFDLTLLEIYKDINKEIWDRFERNEITQEEIKTQRFRILAEKLNISIDAREFSLDYLTYLSQNTDLIDQADSILEKLHRKYNLALVTNGLSQVQKPRIASSSVKSFFSKVIISEEIGFAKPHTGFFDITFQRIGDPERHSVLIIGDSLTSDIQGGMNYAIDTCWYNPFNKPRPEDLSITFEINTLPELLNIL